MAYGKIKCDQIVYDDSGDQTVTVQSLAEKAPSASPTFTGTVTVPTASANDNTTKAASTAYVQTELGDYAPLAGATFTGNVVMSANLTVQGTTTTISSTTIEVADKNLELGKVSTPTDRTADGGGITLKGSTDKEIKWVDSTDAWTFNQNIAQTLTAQGGFTATAAGNHAIQIIGDANRSVDGNTLLSLHGKWNGTQVAMIDIQAGSDTTNKDNGQIVFYTAAAGSTTEALRIHENQAAVFTGTVSDDKGNLRKVIQNTQGSAYTLVAADAGKHILASGTVTIPNSVFAAGDAVTIVNNTAGNLTLTASVGTLYNTADAATGNRTLAARGMATILFASATVGYISGAGLS